MLGIARNVAILKDPNGALTIDEIQKAKWQSEFIPSVHEVINFSPDNGYYWIKFSVFGTLKDEAILFLDEAKLLYADLYYQLEDSSWSVVKNGLSVPSGEKNIVHHFQVFPLKLIDHRVNNFYLRLKPEGIPIPIYITSSKYFFQVHDARFRLFFGLVIGIMLFVCFNNFLIFFSTGDKLRLLYSVTCFLFVIHAVLFNGIILSVSNLLYENLVYIIAPITFISQLSVLIYGGKFLRIFSSKKWLRVWLIISLSFTALLFVMSLVFNKNYFFVSVAMIQTNGIIVLSTCLLMAVMAWRESDLLRKKIIRVYITSYVLFLFFLFMEIGHMNFDWPYFLFVRYIEIGFLCEAIGLSIALNRQSMLEMQQIELEKNRALNENTLLITERNEVLEREVNQRTNELQNKSKVAEMLTEDLKVQSNELRGLNQFKDRILSILSHDLRSPLAQLQSLLGLAEKSYLSDEELKVLLLQLKRQVGSTFDLTNNLLYWAKSQMAGFQATNRYFNLHELVEDKFTFFESIANDKKLMLINKVPLEFQFFSDDNIIRLVIHNIITNATKFCNNGGVITVGARQEGIHVIISIADTGIGMSADSVKNIFDNSFRSKRGTANEKGTGLGLKICKDLIDRLGGHIWVESSLGEGTVFYISMINNYKKDKPIPVELTC